MVQRKDGSRIFHAPQKGGGKRRVLRIKREEENSEREKKFTAFLFSCDNEEGKKVHFRNTINRRGGETINVGGGTKFHADPKRKGEGGKENRNTFFHIKGGWG